MLCVTFLAVRQLPFVKVDNYVLYSYSVLCCLLLCNVLKPVGTSYVTMHRILFTSAKAESNVTINLFP